MLADPQVDLAIRTTLHRYCQLFDSGSFAAFAKIFERGRWFMVTEPGADAVRSWIEHHVILYGGAPLTRHTISNVVVVPGDDEDEAGFSSYVDISQQLPQATPSLLALARFTGTFRRHPDGWWWSGHAMDLDYAGDLSAHIKGGLAALG